jgi:5-methylcytosine-specific restriction protein B
LIRTLTPELTLEAIRARARGRHFISFGEVALAQDIPWPQLRRSIGDHLKAVCSLALRSGGPLVSSVVVNRHHVATGLMEPETRAGFLAAAHDLGFSWEGGESFLRDQQEATFAWAKGPSAQR